MKNMPNKDIIKKEIRGKMNKFLLHYGSSDREDIEKRNKNYNEIGILYYDIVTDIYERGWGESFHFGFPFRGESYNESIKRLEYYISSNLNAHKGDRLLDVGCGIGGPMRNISRFSHASVTGITNSEYQIKKGDKINRSCGLSGVCSFVNADFMKKFPFENDSFDGVYSFEAICYAPVKERVYSEIFRVLKPGAYFSGTDWALTPEYDPDNREHFYIKESLAKTNGITDFETIDRITAHMQAAGFEIVEIRDLARESAVPWYTPLEAGWSLQKFRNTVPGRFLALQMVKIMELIHVLPEGSVSALKLTRLDATFLLKAARLQIFTPGMFFLARKPKI